jgi:hypothetical protein
LKLRYHRFIQPLVRSSNLSGLSLGWIPEAEELPATADAQLLREQCVLQQEHEQHDVGDDRRHDSTLCSRGRDDRVLVQNSEVQSMKSAVAAQAKYEIEFLARIQIGAEAPDRLECLVPATVALDFDRVVV